MNNITSSKSSIGTCEECLHFYHKDWSTGCAAFPEGIPYDIFRNSHSHNKVLPDQVGDFVFEMKERYKKVYVKIQQGEKKDKKPLQKLKKIFKKIFKITS